MNSTITQWIPLIVAFTAGAFALQQIRSNNITNARIKWLDNLKQVLAEFLAESSTLQLKLGLKIGIEEKGKVSPMLDSTQNYYYKINESIIDHLKLISSKYDLIKLNLNPIEILHLKLEKLLNEYMNLLNEMPKHKTIEDYNALLRKIDAYSETIVILVRYIMKLEWEKTKRHYVSRLYFMKFSKGKILLKEALELKLLPERLASTKQK